jgi:hypothetical protein
MRLPTLRLLSSLTLFLSGDQIMNAPQRTRRIPATAGGLVFLAACALSALESSPAAAADVLALVASDGGEYRFEGHFSLYLGLLGGDLKAGQSATGRARLVIGRALSDEDAVKMFQDYVRTLSRH